METVRIHYYDKYNRPVIFNCTVKEFNKYIVEWLEEHTNLDKSAKIYYTYNMETVEFDYYNLPRIR